MINVTVLVDSENCYCGILMSGHAGHAIQHHEGQELVCSAVSALTLNMANSVEHFTDSTFEAEMEEESGTFHFRFLEKADAGATLLMNSLIFGLTDIEETYGEPYIKIRCKEV